jgi:hypothetical protein
VEFAFLVLVQLSFIQFVSNPLPLIRLDMALDKSPFLELAAVLA